MIKSVRSQGYLYVIISSLLYGSMPVLAKLAYESGLGPTNVLWMRYAFSFMVLFVYLRIVKGRSSVVPRRLILAQAVAFVASGILFFYALKYMAAGLAIIIMFTYPLWVTLLARIVYREKPDKKLVLSMLCAMAGIALISFKSQNTNYTGLGALLAFGGSAAYSLYTLIGQKTVAYGDTLPLINSFFAFGALIIAILYPMEVASLTKASFYQIGIGIVMAIFNTLLAVFFHLRGVAKIGASRAGFAGTAEPVFVIILAAIFLGEHLNALQIAGSALVISSLLFIMLPSEPPEPQF